MPERSFGRTVRYRRTKLGLSQAQLGELVGRSAGTIRLWERDATTPRDPAVVRALSAVLDFDERALFEKARLPFPEEEETADVTMEQALASLAPEEKAEVAPEPEPERVSRPIEPIYTYSTSRLINTTQTRPVVELSYIEDRAQRQLYRVRNLATVVILVGLVVVLLWSYTNAFDALSSWWDDFSGSLRL